VIVCKRPVVLHDVDVFGLIALTAIGLATWWFVARPWEQTWRDYRALAAQRRVVETRLQTELRELERFERGLNELRTAVATQAQLAPQATSISHVLREMTELARASNLEILSVVPQAAEREGAYLVNEIHVMARGQSTDFIRFLDQLALTNPYQSLTDCRILRPAKNMRPTCELSWSLRLYLLPLDSAGDPT
jgi:Tfp pilus assembly protein PilO